MNEKDLDLTKTAVDWTDKAFRGNGDCAAIARTTGKTCKVVLRDGEDTSFLEGIHSREQRSLCFFSLAPNGCSRHGSGAMATLEKFKYLAITEITNNLKTP